VVVQTTQPVQPRLADLLSAQVAPAAAAACYVSYLKASVIPASCCRSAVIVTQPQGQCSCSSMLAAVCRSTCTGRYPCSRVLQQLCEQADFQRLLQIAAWFSMLAAAATGSTLPWGMCREGSGVVEAYLQCDLHYSLAVC
jgi:hypothetical protein